MFEIKHAGGTVLFKSETALDVRECLAEAVKACANLRGANLEDANLEDAYLEGAYLRGAYLRGANLRGANLRGANLRGAYLEDANLRGAYLEGAYLRGAYLRGAYLEGAKIHDEPQSIAPYQIQGFKWAITITRNSMQIGCQVHTHKEWKEFTDTQISAMHSDALEFWVIKPILMKFCAMHKKASALVKLPEVSA